MNHRITLVFGLAVLLITPMASAGQDGRWDRWRERAEIRRELREASGERHRAAAEARRERRIERADRQRAAREVRRERYRREYPEALREARRASREALRRLR